MKRFMILTGFRTKMKVLASSDFSFIDDVTERSGTEFDSYRKIFYSGTESLRVRETVEEIIAKLDRAAAAEFAARGEPQ